MKKTILLLKTRAILAVIFCICSTTVSFAQCKSKINIKLSNNKGGVYTNQKVGLKSLNDAIVYNQVSNEKGEVTFEVPCDQRFEVTIANYTRREEVSSPEYPNSSSFEEFSYAPDMAAKDAVFAMSEAEKSQLESAMKSLPDTTKIAGSVMGTPAKRDYYMSYKISLIGLDTKPLVNEVVIISGKNRNKHFKGKTDAFGNLTVFLPKGDLYTVNFLYKKDFYTHEVSYTVGAASGSMSLMYMGTAEYLRRKKIEEDRIKAEEKHLEEERKRLEAWIKESKLAGEEAIRRRMAEYEKETNGVVNSVMDRNKWSEKLIVCDLTGSMMPYAGQLCVWYKLNYMKEKNLQFVFFNDGNEMPDNKKIIGNTGGIYYQDSKGLDSLVLMMSLVQSIGSGGDCAENNMEALIKGTRKAKPYKELVMIADNNAPVKDISLLSEFSNPVHIIVCGSTGWIHPDYLKIAWKTKGSIHTIEEDITKIATMLEGQSITIKGITYKLMGGEFVEIRKT